MNDDDEIVDEQWHEEDYEAYDSLCWDDAYDEYMHRGDDNG